MSEAPKDIWINWKAANAADLAYNEPPITQWDDVSQHYRRADLCADPALLAEAVEVVRYLLSDVDDDLASAQIARAFLAKLENRHDR